MSGDPNALTGGPAAGVSVVVPVFNGADTLPALAARLANSLPAAARAFEAILVNDGSADGSWAAIGQLAERYPWMVGIDLERNYGQCIATLCGVRHARFGYVVTMDDDLEHAPEWIGPLLGRLNDGDDVAYGTAPPPHRGWVRGVGRAIMRPLLLKELGAAGVRRATAFRAFRTELRAGFPRHGGGAICLDVLLARGATKVSYVAVEPGRCPGTRSSYSVGVLVARSLALLLKRGALSAWPGRPARADEAGYRVRARVGAAGRPPEPAHG